MTTNSTVEGCRALLVPVVGELRDVVLTNRDDEYLAALYELIDCEYVEHVRGPGCSLWVDEEGALDPVKPPNPRIDALLQRSDGWSIRGDVVITGETREDGATRSLAADEAARLREALAR